MSLLVMIPTRGRRKQVERLLESFWKNTDSAEIMFILDPDDEETYEGIDWGSAMTVTLSPRGTVVEKLNRTSSAFWDDYDALMFTGNDHVFRTEGWDAIMLRELKDMGGTGMIYPDDRRRHDIPEIIMISSDIVRAMGQFAEASLSHFYIDNVWADLGKRTGLLRFCPEVIIQHHHYSVDPETEHDELYKYAENSFGASDLQAYQQWRAVIMPHQVAVLRRAFSEDVAWVLGKVLCGGNHGSGGCRRNGARFHHSPGGMQCGGLFHCEHYLPGY